MENKQKNIDLTLSNIFIGYTIILLPFIKLQRSLQSLFNNENASENYFNEFIVERCKNLLKWKEKEKFVILSNLKII